MARVTAGCRGVGWCGARWWLRLLGEVALVLGEWRGSGVSGDVLGRGIGAGDCGLLGASGGAGRRGGGRAALVVVAWVLGDQWERRGSG